MRFLYVTGTDTGAGKTRVTAALARAANERGGPVDVVKLVQTGLAPCECGDAEDAAARAGCAWHELHRFPLAADPWAAALAAGVEPLRADALARELEALPHDAIVEGSGGVAVPLNETESISDATRATGCDTIVTIGLRLGCISHALLTLEYLARRGMPVRGVVLCEAWGPTENAYRRHVERAVAPYARVAGTLAFEPDARRGVVTDAAIVAKLLSLPRDVRAERIRGVAR